MAPLPLREGKECNNEYGGRWVGLRIGKELPAKRRNLESYQPESYG